MPVNDDFKTCEPIIIWDESEQFSVMNMLPDMVKNRCKARREEAPDLFNMDEQELYKEMRIKRHTPSASDNRIRLKFWMEYDECRMNYNKYMNVKRIAAGTANYEFFILHYLKNCYLVAWMLMPPVNYKDRMIESLDFGLDQMREILNLPLQDEEGNLDHKLAAMKITIFKMLDDRSNGVAVQRLEQKTLQIKADIKPADMRKVQELANTMNLEEMRALHSDRARQLRFQASVNPEKYGTAADKSVIENVVFDTSHKESQKGNSHARKNKEVKEEPSE
jgi:hypothetical protein